MGLEGGGWGSQVAVFGKYSCKDSNRQGATPGDVAIAASPKGAKPTDPLLEVCSSMYVRFLRL